MSICKVRGQLVKGPFSEEHSGHSSNFLIETAKSCASRLGKELSKQDYTASVPLWAPGHCFWGCLLQTRESPAIGEKPAAVPFSGHSSLGP